MQAQGACLLRHLGGLLELRGLLTLARKVSLHTPPHATSSGAPARSCAAAQGARTTTSNTRVWCRARSTRRDVDDKKRCGGRRRRREASAAGGAGSAQGSCHKALRAHVLHHFFFAQWLRPRDRMGPVLTALIVHVAASGRGLHRNPPLQGMQRCQRTSKSSRCGERTAAGTAPAASAAESRPEERRREGEKAWDGLRGGLVCVALAYVSATLRCMCQPATSDCCAQGGKCAKQGLQSCRRVCSPRTTTRCAWLLAREEVRVAHLQQLLR